MALGVPILKHFRVFFADFSFFPKLSESMCNKEINEFYLTTLRQWLHWAVSQRKGG